MTAAEVLYLPGAIEDLAEIERYLESVASAEVASNYVDWLKEYIETFTSSRRLWVNRSLADYATVRRWLRSGHWTVTESRSPAATALEL